jgi:hypothetical protein
MTALGDSVYRAVYESGAITCNAIFSTQPSDNSLFYPACVKVCNVCGKEHSFNLVRSIVISSKAQAANVQEWFEDHYTDTQVEVEQPPVE